MRCVLFAALGLCSGALAGGLIFSSPSLVAVTTSAEAGELQPWVPEHFLGLSRPDNVSAAPLLFGAHGPSSYDFSSDGGSSFVSFPADVPFYGNGVTFQTNQWIPSSTAPHPESYHDLGRVHGVVTLDGWSRSNITTVRAAAGGGLSFTYDALAHTNFTGIPFPGLNTTFNPAHPQPKVFGFLPLTGVGGGYVCVAAVIWAGEALNPSPDGLTRPLSLLAFVSSDSYNWRFSSVVANFSSFPGLVLGPSESDIAYLPDGKTIAVVFRMDGDAGCSSNSYRNYYTAHSADGGATWTWPVPLPGLGCVRPKLLHVPGWPLILSGGRNCVANTMDITLWTSATGAPGVRNWVDYSITYHHNRLWQGNASFLFNASVNDTNKWQTLSYTSIVRTSPDSFVIFYNKFLALVGWPPWPSANFVMQVRVV
jgi:hypothetical protein